MQHPERDMGSQVPAHADMAGKRTIGMQGAMLHLLMIMSGFAGPGYEMVWTRMLSVALGHEILRY